MVVDRLLLCCMLGKRCMLIQGGGGCHGNPVAVFDVAYVQ